MAGGGLGLVGRARARLKSYHFEEQESMKGDVQCSSSTFKVGCSVFREGSRLTFGNYFFEMAGVSLMEIIGGLAIRKTNNWDCALTLKVV
jgi:hypothetical protein